MVKPASPPFGGFLLVPLLRSIFMVRCPLLLFYSKRLFKDEFTARPAQIKRLSFFLPLLRDCPDLLFPRVSGRSIFLIKNTLFLNPLSPS